MKKITKFDILNMDRAARRSIDIELGINRSSHRIHQSKKSYTRKIKHKYEETF
jgi:hypothetical protein